MDPRLPLIAVAAPTVVTLVALWLLWRRADKVESRERAVATAALPLVVFAPAWALADGIAAPPPPDAFGWAPWAVIASGVLGVLGAAWREGLAASLMRVLVFAVPAVMLRADLQNPESDRRMQATFWIAGAGVAGLVAFTALRRAGRERGPAVPLLVVISLSLGAAALALTGNIRQPVMLGTMCALAGPGFIVALRRPWYHAGWSLAPAAACAPAMWFHTARFGETPIWCGVLLAASFAAVPLSAAGPLARLSGWRRWLVRVALVAAPGLAAVAVALANQPPAYGEV